METKPKVKMKDVSLITILSRVNNIQCQQWKHYINVLNGSLKTFIIKTFKITSMIRRSDIIKE